MKCIRSDGSFLRLFTRFYSGYSSIQAFALVAMAFTCLASCRCTSELGKDRIRDSNASRIILIVVDTLRADALSCYGNSGNHTPNIDRLASHGIVFQSVMAPSSWTLPSVFSIMTGYSPWVHRSFRQNSELPEFLRTLAEYFKGAGFVTAAAGFNPYLKPVTHLDKGFDEYHMPIQDWYKDQGREAPVVFPDRDNQYRFNSTPSITEFTLEWLGDNGEDDFFLWLHFMDPHMPYAPPPEFMPEQPIPDHIMKKADRRSWVLKARKKMTAADWKSLRALYDAEVRWVDAAVGKILGRLEELGLYEESMIVLTSDHGEEFHEHEGFEHGHSLYSEVMHVPLVVKLPASAGRVPSGFFSRGRRSFRSFVVTETVSVVGIVPLILDACGVTGYPESLMGHSLSPLVGLSPERYAPHPTYGTGILYHKNKEAVIFDGMKYIRTPSKNKEELYDIAKDPGEKRSIAKQRPESVAKAVKLLKDQDAAAGKVRAAYEAAIGGQFEMDEETIEELRALGYIL